MDRAQDSLYSVEHGGAWLMALAAIVLGVAGLLTGHSVIGPRETAEGTNGLPGIDVNANTDAGVAGILENNFWDGAMLLFAAMAAAMLAYCLHASDHHRMRD